MSPTALKSEQSKQQALFEIADRVLPGAGLGSYAKAHECGMSIITNISIMSVVPGL